MTGDRLRKIAISPAKNKVQFRDKARHTRRKIRLARKAILCKAKAQENGANDIPPRDVLQKKRDNRLEGGARPEQMTWRRETQNSETERQRALSASALPEGVPRVPKVREVSPPVSARRRRITLRWNPWGSYRMAPSPPPEPPD